MFPLCNTEKMQNGIALLKEDRIPWLETLRDCLGITSIVNGKSVQLGCSALQKHYRNILRSTIQITDQVVVLVP